VHFQICARCPKRASGDVPRACERRCPLFRNLERLLATAQAREPMIYSRRRAAEAAVQAVCDESKPAAAVRADNPLRRFGNPLVTCLAESMRGR
jgi:hypothetical protein